MRRGGCRAQEQIQAELKIGVRIALPELCG
jgi:hypothetical protein